MLTDSPNGQSQTAKRPNLAIWLWDLVGQNFWLTKLKFQITNCQTVWLFGRLALATKGGRMAKPNSQTVSAVFRDCFFQRFLSITPLLSCLYAISLFISEREKRERANMATHFSLKHQKNLHSGRPHPTDS